MKNRRLRALWLAALCLGVGGRLAAQQEQVTVPFKDPSRPGTLTVTLVHGSITVRGTNRKDVLVATRPRADTRGRRDNADATGLRRLIAPAAFKIVEDFNEMSIASENPNRAIDFEIQAPIRTHLKLSTVNGGEIVVDAIDGNMEIENTNGSITLTSVSGSAVANTTNGNVLVTFLRLSPQRSMAFTSFNGRVDVTLPAATKANLRLRSDQGHVYTDFELALKPSAAPVVKESNRDRGRYQVTVNNSIDGSINGGGPDIELRTFNGHVYIRKGK